MSVLLLSKPCSQASFHVLCLSINGLMLNGHFLGNDSGEQALQHGDALALAAVVEASLPVEQQSRKPFVVFQFEVLGPSPAAEALPTAYPTPGQTVMPKGRLRVMKSSHIFE